MNNDKELVGELRSHLDSKDIAIEALRSSNQVLRDHLKTKDAQLDASHALEKELRERLTLSDKRNEELAGELKLRDEKLATTEEKLDRALEDKNTLFNENASLKDASIVQLEKIVKLHEKTSPPPMFSTQPTMSSTKPSPDTHMQLAPPTTTVFSIKSLPYPRVKFAPGPPTGPSHWPIKKQGA